MNTERFEERLMQELKSYVRLRGQDQLSATGESDAAAAVDEPAPVEAYQAAIGRPAGRLRVRPRTLAVAAGLTAAIGAAVLAGTTAATNNADRRPAQPLFYVANAAYSVKQEPQGIVKLTILDADGKPDADTLRSDLAKAGVNARVLSDVPDCRSPQPRPSPETQLPPAGLIPDHTEFENGRLVYYLNTKELFAGRMFTLMYGQSLQSFEVILGASDYRPTCIATAAYH
jgi:hypothetical protein